jgi:hypothetical protein
MLVECFNSEFEIPDLLINKFVKQFEGLAGSGNYESVLELRNGVSEVIDYIAEDPEALHEKMYLSDFIKALAIQKALAVHGILYDA